MDKELYVYPEITEEQLQALKDEVMDFVVLGTQDIDNTKLNYDEDGTVAISEGDLLHGTKYDEKKLISIAVNGIITREFFGAKEKGRTHYHAEFYRANKDMSLSEFVNDERTLFPNKKGIVAFLIVNSPAVVELFKNNSLEPDSNVTEEIQSLVVGGFEYHKEEVENKTIAAIPIGVPANCFSALVVSDDILEDNDKLEALKSLFSRLNILNTKGQVVVKSEEQRDE